MLEARRSEMLRTELRLDRRDPRASNTSELKWDKRLWQTPLEDGEVNLRVVKDIRMLPSFTPLET